ncbi:hypothetical protein TEA_014042 [Camellia sinensis var. sinensis]|uniref:Uncharacterized protein n=1 Tax=Camellia sinensis var. sinensis TaxID=542762 RepID=A0A4S4DZ66_CAMSN|nr:hypothetical protein TEA_014042 [Camellia sinensis var. sinensis]
MKLGLTMKNLKILRCPRAKCFQNHHLVAIADALPWLEELDIYFSDHNFDSKSAKYIMNDVGIEVMSHGDHDRVLSSISTTGIPLEKILIYEDSGLSSYGLSTFLCACPSLTHLTLHDIDFLNDDSMRDFCQYLSSFVYIKLSCSTLTGITFFLLTKECPVLSEIDLGFLKLQVEDDLDMVLERNYRIRSWNLGCYHDRILSSISTVGIPLEKILIYEDSGLSSYGLSTFLCACPSLTHLTLHDIDFLNDDSIRDLCQYLSSFVYIKLSCSTLTGITFFLLTKECLVLSEIDLGFLKLQVEDDLDMVLERNYRIRSLNLGFCQVNRITGKLVILKENGKMMITFYTIISKRNVGNNGEQILWAPKFARMKEMFINWKSLREINLNWGVHIGRDFAIIEALGFARFAISGLSLRFSIYDFIWLLVDILEKCDTRQMNFFMLLLCCYGSNMFVINVVQSFSFDELVKYVCNKWCDLSADLITMFYRLPGYTNCHLDNNEELQNMLLHGKSIGVERIDVVVEQKLGTIDIIV